MIASAIGGRVFRDDRQYVDMNVGAQRRSPATLAAPALVWHRAFWRPKDVSPTEWQRNIDWYLYSLYCAIEKQRLQFNADNPTSTYSAVCQNVPNGTNTINLFRHTFDLPRDPTDTSLSRSPNNAPKTLSDRLIRHDTFQYRSAIQGIFVTLQAELHYEYWTLSYMFDFSSYDDSVDLGDAELRLIGNLILSLHQIAKRNFDPPNITREPGGEEVGASEKSEESEIRRIRPVLLRGVRRWCDRLERAAFAELPSDAASGCGGIFANFTILTMFLRPSFEEPTVELIGADGLASARKVESQAKGVKFESETALKVVDSVFDIAKRFSADDLALKAFYASSTPTHEDDIDLRSLEQFGKPEFTATRLQGCHSILISSLGRQYRGTSHIESSPTAYCLIVSYRSKWRLGRLIDRILTIETTRLAAVRDLRQITRAGERLKSYLDLAKRHKPERKYRGGRFPQRLAEGIRLSANIVPDGLIYRISKSQYYVERFRSLLPQMRCERIDGFPSYESFLTRKVFDTFEFIRRTGERYSELRSLSSYLLQVDRFLDQTDQVRSTNKLLDHAEIIIAMPIAYYAGDVLYRLFETKKCLQLTHPGAMSLGVLFAVSVAYLIRYGDRLPPPLQRIVGWLFAPPRIIFLVAAIQATAIWKMWLCGLP